MTTTPEVDPGLISTVSQFFEDKFDHNTVTHAEEAGFLPELWDATAQLGLPLVAISEDRVGSGGTLMDLLAILHLAGRYAVPLPLAETHLAAWLLAESGQDVPEGALTVAPGTPRDTLTLDGDVLSGAVHDVPWARHVTRIVALVDGADGPQVVSWEPSECTITPGTDLAGQARDLVDASGVKVTPVSSAQDGRSLFLRGALVRSAQMAGAMEAASDLTRAYVSERVQFGKPIGSFQSVQQHIVILAQMAAMTGLSVTRAGRACSGQGDASFEICALKLTANQNATDAIRAAHQAHGAIGMTQEYHLQHLTRRLNAWRSEFGTEGELALRLGAAAAHADSFAHMISSVDHNLEV